MLNLSHTMLPVVKKMYFVWVSLVHTALIPQISDGPLSKGSITGSVEEVSAKLQTELGFAEQSVKRVNIGTHAEQYPL